MYARYTYGCKYVGRQEHLANDLVLILEQLGLEFDKEMIRLAGNVKVNATDDKDLYLENDLAMITLKNESAILSRYYNDAHLIIS